MANIYVRSSDGSDSDNGSTWALAKATLAGAAAIDAAGDRIYLSKNHAESSASDINVTINGSLASPVWIVSVDDTGSPEPPTSEFSGATITTTGNTAITITAPTGSAGWVLSGITMNSGSGDFGGGVSLMASDSGFFSVRNSKLRVVATESNRAVSIGTGTGGWQNRGVLEDVWVRVAHSGQKVAFNNGSFSWRGGGIEAGGTAPSTLIVTGTDCKEVLCDSLDLSAGGSSMNLLTATTAPVRAVFRNCKLPASWSGGLWSGALTRHGPRAEMYNCDSGDTNYRLWVEDFTGSIKQETTIVRSGGASDGTTSLSWKMATNADAEYPALVLESPEIARWNETVGSAITVTVDVVHNAQGSGSGGALTNAEMWLEVQYLGTNGVPLGTFTRSRKALMATAADNASSSATWTTTALASPVKQRLSVTFTPQEKGVIQARIVVAKASATVYVDPVLQVS